MNNFDFTSLAKNIPKFDYNPINIPTTSYFMENNIKPLKNFRIVSPTDIIKKNNLIQEINKINYSISFSNKELKEIKTKLKISKESNESIDGLKSLFLSTLSGIVIPFFLIILYSIENIIYGENLCSDIIISVSVLILILLSFLFIFKYLNNLINQNRKKIND